MLRFNLSLKNVVQFQLEKKLEVRARQQIILWPETAYGSFDRVPIERSLRKKNTLHFAARKILGVQPTYDR